MKAFETKFMDLDSRQIRVDTTYQRPVSDAEIKTIIKNWNPNIQREPHVSFREGKYWVFDGQHTILSLVAKNKGKPVTVRCKVFYGMTQLDEAELFLLQDGNSRDVTPMQQLKTRYNMGDPKIVSLVHAVEGAGIKMIWSGGAKDNGVVCARSLERAYDTLGAIPFASMMKTITKAWDGDKVGLSGQMVDGMAVFYKKYYGMFNEKSLITRLSNVKPSRIKSEIDGKFGDGKQKIAEIILEIYNKKCTVNKLPA